MLLLLSCTNKTAIHKSPGLKEKERNIRTTFGNIDNITISIETCLMGPGTKLRLSIWIVKQTHIVKCLVKEPDFCEMK